ncbi:alpha/beta fold hydrolase [Streptomyces mirabilis]|uniref:alpha/beta hydrolase n=1 Tax=Streptomyces mirabilis TaxID=68239 RepID=UPI00365695E7
MPAFKQREKVRFASGDTSCAAWHYPGSNGGCVIMAGGTSVTKEPASDLFAARFNDAGFAVLAFDHRRFGESGGAPRQIVRLDEQVADWHAAIECATGLPDVGPDRISVWGFSLVGGHVFRVAADHPRLACAIAQTPVVDGRALAPHALHSMTSLSALRLFGRGVADALGGLVGRPPLLVPTAGPRGVVASLTTPDAMDGDRPSIPAVATRIGSRRSPHGSPCRSAATGPAAMPPGSGAPAGRRLRPGPERTPRPSHPGRPERASVRSGSPDGPSLPSSAARSPCTAATAAGPRPARPYSSPSTT